MARRRPAPSHHLIVENADWGQIITARKDGVSWDQLRTRTGLPALGMAIYSGSALAVHTLLEMGAPIDSEPLVDKTIFSPLWSALEKRKPQIMDALLQAGADPDEEHPDYGRPLGYTAERAMTEETLVLCRHGARPNTETSPSPLWLWIKNLTPQPNPDKDEWIFPDSTPVLALLKNGARIHGDDPANVDDQAPADADRERGRDNEGAFNEIAFAKRQWLRNPLSAADMQHVHMTLAMMEKNLFAANLADREQAVREAPTARM